MEDLLEEVLLEEEEEDLIKMMLIKYVAMTKMKYFLFFILLGTITFTSYSQSRGYSSLSLLFSRDDANGTARFNAMGGAFGALGSDISSIQINPAGGVVANNSVFSATLDSENTDITATYYGISTPIKNNEFKLSQVGGTLVFSSAYDSDWNRYAFSFNYRTRANFNHSFSAQGNSGFSSFNEFPLDKKNPKIKYNDAENQYFSNTTSGKSNEFIIGFSSVYKKNLFIGASLNIQNFTYGERDLLIENNNDGNGNKLTANFYQENYTTGSGFSLSAGIIYKVNQNFRFGLAYKTPTWFSEIIEQSNITDNNGFLGNVEIGVSNDQNNIYRNFSGNLTSIYPGDPAQGFIYKLKTPSKLTLSTAYVFGKEGLISIDYSYRNYTSINLSNGNFTNENQFFTTGLRNISSLNIGGEWRLSKFSLRAGYNYEQSPYKNAISSDNLKRYSFGGGYNFGTMKIDLAYSNGNKTEAYNMYPNYKSVNSTELKIDTRNFAITISFNL